MSQKPPRGGWCITPGVEASQRIEWLLCQVELWNSGDVDGVVDAFGPEFEFTPDPSFPDAGTYREPCPRGGAWSWLTRQSIGVSSCLTRLGCLKKPTEEARGG
jgi:hypothetical protein